MRSRKTAKSVQKDIYYLRETFGPICPDLTLKSTKISLKCKKRPSSHPPAYVEATYFEQISTTDFATFIAT